MLTLNERTVNLKVTRRELIDLMISASHIRFDMEDEMRNPETTADRREVLKGSIKKWEALHDKLKAQLDAFDAAHGF